MAHSRGQQVPVGSSATYASESFLFFFFFGASSSAGSASASAFFFFFFGGSSAAASSGSASASRFFFFFGASSAGASSAACFFFFFATSTTPSSTTSPSAAAASFFFFFRRRFFTSLMASCMTSMFFLGVVPSERKARRSSTWSRSFSPKTVEDSSEKLSIREAREHLFARYREMRPLFFCWARPMKVEWKMRPYFGVFPFVFSARKSAFSAPRICTVDAGYLARFVRLPACEISRAPIISPIKAERLGATRSILAFRYSCRLLRMLASLMTSFAKWSMFLMSIATMSWPIDIFIALRTSFATSSAPHASTSWSLLSSGLKASRTPSTRATFA
mmetsp:Transcript_4881/g.14168  ORF Transcript_4881/g.14168 Transcript_4881/m.14168 type:complete len:333 (+) Transcript_4881:75-1073(+)